MNYITYYRVSTRKQDLGLDAQKSMIDNFLRPEDTVLATYEEKETGTNKKVRTQLTEALKQCQATGATLLIAKLDRLARNVAFVSNLMESGVKFVALDLPEANELTIHIFAAIAQHEAKIISERTKAALNELKKQGVVLGKPDNFSSEGRAAGRAVHSAKAESNINTKQAKAYAGVLKEQGYNLTQIADKLNEHQYKTARGKQYHPMQVSRLLK